MRIKSAKITKLALCRRGMNGLRTLYKADDGTIQIETLMKASADFAESGEILAVAWIPDHADKAGDWCERHVVKEMLYEHMREGAKLDISHDGKVLTREQAYVAEAFLIQKGDPRFEGWQTYTGHPVDVTGGWGTVIKVDDPALRKAHREDGWSGVSIEGTAVVDDVPPPIKKEDDMALTDDDVKKIRDLIKAEREADEKAKAEALRKEQDEKAAKAKATEVVFEGDANDPKAVRKHLAKVKAAKVDWNDPKQVEAHLASLCKADDEDGMDGADDDDDDDGVEDEEESSGETELQKEERRHARRMRELNGRSVAPLKAGGKRLTKAEQLEKEDRDAIKRCADRVNKELGRA